MRKKIYGLIIAKGESKRLPNKNKIDFLGKPMFVWNLEKCLQIFEKTFVSSEDDEILSTAYKLGAHIIKRPKKLCGDVPNIPVYQHSIKYMGRGVKAIIVVQANSPTIHMETIKLSKEFMDNGTEELMTIHKNGEIYGSIWAITKDRLEDYWDAYNPNPQETLYDLSIDIHTPKDLEKAKLQAHGK